MVTESPFLPPQHDIPFESFKKNGSPELTTFLKVLTEYAQNSGVWQAILDALADSSYVVQPDQIRELPKNVAGHSAQGLITTGYEHIDTEKLEVVDIREVYAEIIGKTIHVWLYYLALFNHPDYLEELYDRAYQPFNAPRKKRNGVMALAKKMGEALCIHDLGLDVGDADKPRTSRTTAFEEGQSITFWRKTKRWGVLPKWAFPEEVGRQQARDVFVVGENPDVVGTPLALASIAATHHLVGIPKDGIFKSVEKQVALARDTIALLEKIVTLVGTDEDEQEQLLDWYINNLAGVIEADPVKGVQRFIALYEAGVRTFRVYSPEPNALLVATVAAMREAQKEKGYEDVEIFAGQVVSVEQAKKLQQAGADALYIGIGGGGRCITGEVANLVINWPQLLWALRGQIDIPVVVQGGANDRPVVTVALGGTAVGVVGKLAGTLETPGGYNYLFDPTTGEYFKFYGGEASDRMRAIAERFDPTQRTANTEGETRIKELLYDPHIGQFPTLLQALLILKENFATGAVFQNAGSIAEVQDKSADRLRRESPFMSVARGTH